MGEPDFDVEKDQKSPDRLKSDTSISADRSEQKQRSDQGYKSDVAAGTSSPKGKININTANREELETLPRIGPVLAQRIIEYRQKHGKFTDIYELMNVTGIGDATLQKFMDLITVGNHDESK